MNFRAPALSDRQRKRSKTMTQEPKMLPWLAKEAGVSVPEARAIWQDVVKQSDTSAEETQGGNAASRQVRNLLKRLGPRNGTQSEPRHESTWILPVPVFLTWIDCQTRLFRSAWLAWAAVLRRVPRAAKP
jgi:polyhydroxyalkanoate synthesis regulator phasin